MAMRLAKVSELNLLIALQQQLWGSRKDAFRSWSLGDEIAFISGKNLAALAQAGGTSRHSEERIWPDDLYPFRIPVRFTHFVKMGERPPLLGEVREALMAEYGAKWGFAMINQGPIPESAARAVRSIFESTPNHIREVDSDLVTLIEQAKVARDVEHVVPRPAEAEAERLQEQEVATQPSSPHDESLHTRAQSALIELGLAAKCAILVASNDRAKVFKGTPLGTRCVKNLPSMGLGAEAMNRIALIDVLWLQHNAPAYAFEIEVTTSVYSGLLRMSDLLALVPALKMNLFIVAPSARRLKVMSELARPTFRHCGLSDYCRFIASESLESLIEKIDDFRGYVQPGIVKTIAEELADDISTESV